jgi:hypothetical protein
MLPHDVDTASRIEEGLVRRVRAALLGVALIVQCGFALPQMFLRPELYRPLAVHGAVFCVLLGVAGLSAYHVLAGRAPSTRIRALGLGMTFLASLLGATTLGPGDVLNAEHWVYGVVGWYCLLLLFGEKWTSLAAVLGAHFLLAVGPLALNALPPARILASMGIRAVSVYGFQLAVGRFAYTVRNIATAAARAAASEERVETERAIAETVHNDREERLLGLLDTTIPLLRALAEGGLDPSDTATQRRCAVEAARLRRLQAEGDDVADPLAHELDAGITVAQRRGVTAQLEVSGPPAQVPREIRRELADPVLSVLSASRSRARVTVAHLPGQVRVSIVGDAPGPRSAGRQTGSVRVEEISLDGEFWLESVWNTDDPSPSL